MASLTGPRREAAAIAAGVVLLLIAGALVFRAGSRAFIAGALVGLLVAAGWAATGILGFDEFDPAQLSSLTFTAPVGESIQFLMIATGDTLRFSIMLVAGVLVGAFLSGLVGGRLAVTGFQSEGAPLRYALGGALMGFGGVTAMGCSMGQGLSGVSTLATGSIIALVAIVAGAAVAHAALDGRLQLPLFNRPRETATAS